MKHIHTRVTALLLAAVILFSALPTSAWAADEPIEISTAAELQAIEADGNYILTNDIDLTNVDWTPLFSDWDSDSFSGTLDGDGHVITGLTLSMLEEDDEAGLFCAIEGGTVKNLGIVDAQVEADGCAAILAANLFGGTIETCFVTGSVSSINWQAGGLVAYMDDGSIINCYAKATIASGSEIAGGIAGAIYNSRSSHSTISYCYADITVSGPLGPISNCNALVGDIDKLEKCTFEHLCYRWSGTSLVGGLLEFEDVAVNLSSFNADIEAAFIGWNTGIWEIIDGAPALKVFSSGATPQLAAPANPRWEGFTAQWDAVEHASSYEVTLLWTGGGSQVTTSNTTWLAFDLATDLRPLAQTMFNEEGNWDYYSRIGFSFQVKAIGDGINYISSNPSISSTEEHKFRRLVGLDADLTLRLPVGTAFSNAGLPKQIDAAVSFEGVASVDVTWNQSEYDSSRAGTIIVTGNYTLPDNYTVVKDGSTEVPQIAVTFYSSKPDSSKPSVSTGVSDPLVIVDGKEVDAGKATVDEDSGVTTTIVNQDVIVSQISDAHENVTVIIPKAESSAVAVAELVVKNIEDMAERDMTLSAQIGSIVYEFSATAVDTATILETLGAEDSAEAPISICVVTVVADENAAHAERVVAEFNGVIVFPPVEFIVTASYGDKSVEVTEFASYVRRTIEVTEEQAKKITTAIVTEADGTVRHVPTFVYEEDGKWYAVINSLTNSTYVLIYNEQVFVDAVGKWYEKMANEMGSRKVIAGVGDGTFAGEQTITRAEFAAMTLRALGLPAKNGNVFTDIGDSDWYAGEVNAAYEYGLVEGVGDNKFEPMRPITRQEAMVVIQRAAEITALIGDAGSLNEFTDDVTVSEWAIEATRFCVGSSIVVGNNGQLMPHKEITRGETAVLLLRLLQQSSLVDRRS